MGVGRRVVAIALLAAAMGGGCAHAPQAQRDARRLRVLELSFHEFTSDHLLSLDDIEPAVARLEVLRADYLDALSAADGERERLLALLRLAEAHLDLSARVRRVPYPASIAPSARAAFDAELSHRALPLEATGLGILDQVVQRGSEVSANGRFVKRARLYQHLQRVGGESALNNDDIEFLRAELVAVSYRAPRSLLDTGRVGQRAARR